MRLILSNPLLLQQILTHQNHLSLCVSFLLCIVFKVRICPPAANSVRSELDYHTKGYSICQPLFQISFTFFFFPARSPHLGPRAVQDAQHGRIPREKTLDEIGGGMYYGSGDANSAQKAADTFPPRRLPEDVGIGFFINRDSRPALSQSGRGFHADRRAVRHEPGRAPFPGHAPCHGTGAICTTAPPRQ